MGHRAAFRGADPSRKLPYRDGLFAALVAADYALAVATLVFLVTYVLISLRTVRRFPIERPAVAMLGGALMLVLGVLTPAQALLAINLYVIVLLVGMMLLVSGLEACGFFDLVSSRIAVRAKSQASFLAWLMVATAALSAIVLNDTIALLVTPVVVRSTRALRVNPVPYLVAVAIAANVGSVATEVGNPQNAFIAIQSGIPFLTFTAYLLPVTVACLAVAIGLVWLAFRKDLAVPLARAGSVEPVRLHVLGRRPIRRPRLAGRPFRAAVEPDQQRACRSLARDDRPARLDAALARARRELDARRQRDDPRGRVQRHRRAGRVPGRGDRIHERLREGRTPRHRGHAGPLDGPHRPPGPRVTDNLSAAFAVTDWWAKRWISRPNALAWWSGWSARGTFRIRGFGTRFWPYPGRCSFVPRMRTMPMPTSHCRSGEARRSPRRR